MTICRNVFLVSQEKLVLKDEQRNDATVKRENSLVAGSRFTFNSIEFQEEKSANKHLLEENKWNSNGTIDVVIYW